jgi:hypothetical protein
MPSPLEALTQINLDDLLSAFGIQGRPALARAVRSFFGGAAGKFARQIVDFDTAICEAGLVRASRRTERLYVRDVRLFGADRLPAGPLLALSNHPGMTDTLALFCALRREDLKVIALNRPFLLSLPNISERLFYVTDDPAARMALVRQVSTHLRAGGAALTFPAGHTEPDPDMFPGALDSLQTWTDSVGVFLRLAPETAVVPVCVRSVFWRAAAYHPLTRLRRTPDDRQLLASALQLLAHVVFNLRPVTVRVQVGNAITARALGSTDTRAIHRAVLAEMARLIQTAPEGEGISAL